jgi:hypothetical protein
MKKLIAAAIAALSIATPAQAQPQWIQVDANGTMFANFNTVRGTGRIRSIDVGFVFSENNRVANTTHIDCKTWQSSFTYQGHTVPWKPIGPGSAIEAVAELVCPRTATVPVPSPAPAPVPC